MKRKRVNLKTVLGFTLATTLALGGLVAADVVINPNTIVAKADEADDVVFDFTEVDNEVLQDTVNDEPDVVDVNTLTQDETSDPDPAEETPPAETPEPDPTPDPNPEQGDNETTDTETQDDTLNPDTTDDNSDVTPNPNPNGSSEETKEPDANTGNENLPGEENEDDSLLPGADDDTTPPDGNNENPDGLNPDTPNPDEHVHSVCYTALDEEIHIMTCTDAECEYAQTENHSDISDGLEDGLCICGFELAAIPDNGNTQEPEDGITDTPVTDAPVVETPDTQAPPVVTQEEYDRVKEQVTQLEQKIKELERKQNQTSSSSSSSSSNNSYQVSNLSNQVSNLQSQNTALQSQNATLNNKNRTMAADISSLQSQVSSLTGKLNSLSNTYAAGSVNSNTSNSLSQTYEGNKKAQVGDIQNLIDSDTYQAPEPVMQNTYSDTLDGINTDTIPSNEVTFDFTAPADANTVESNEVISESELQSQTTSITPNAAYAPFNGMPVNSLANTRATRQKAMAAAATVGSISFTSMIGLYIYGRKKGLLGKKEISIDDLINDEEETGAACPA